MSRNFGLARIVKNNLLAAGLTVIGLASLLAAVTPGGFAREAKMSEADRLMAIHDIKMLKARYFRCVDTKDWVCWGTQVFAKDFVYDTHSAARPPIHGPDGMVALMHDNGLYDRVKTVHMGHMPEIEILSPTTARGIWAADFMHFTPLGQPYPITGKEVAAPGKDNHSYTFYVENYVKEEGGWRIKNMDNSTMRLRSDDNGGITIPSPPPAK